MNQPTGIRGPLAPETQRVLNGAWAESAQPLTEPQGQRERSRLATGSARMTLMRGTPEEIERDLEAVDAQIAALTQERNDWREKHWNAHHHSQEMFKEIARLRRALDEIHTRLGRNYGIDSNGVESACYEIAHSALGSPNKKAEPPARS